MFTLLAFKFVHILKIFLTRNNCREHCLCIIDEVSAYTYVCASFFFGIISYFASFPLFPFLIQKSDFYLSVDSPSSSADSYSSSSSTRKLLSAPLHELQTTTAATTATIPTPSLAASRIIDIKVRDDKKISIEKAVDV